MSGDVAGAKAHTGWRTESRQAMAIDLAVEMLGTFALVFMGVSAVVGTGGNNLLAIALAHGLAIAVMVGATGHISGGAFNPAVAVALGIARKLDPMRAVGYVAAQLLGGVLATLVVKLAFPAALTDAVKVGVPAVGSGFSVGNAFVAELVTTFFLAYVIFGVAIDKRGSSTSAALVIGLCVTMDILAIGPVSGGAMNPARWFGPAVVQGQFDNAWIWIVAPPVGAVLAAVVYFYGYLRGGSQSDLA